MDYVREAFRYRPRVKGLGRLPLNPLALAAFGVLGLLNPGFWFVGAAAELGYLAWLSSHPSFQKIVRGRRLATERETYDQRLRQAEGALGPEARKRFERLRAQAAQVGGEALRGEAALEDLLELRSGGLSQLLSIFLRLLLSRETLLANLKEVRREALEEEIAALERRLEEADDGSPEQDSPLERSLKGSLDIARRRLANLDRARENLAVIDAELARIEAQVMLIREEAAVQGKAEALSSRLDAVSATLSETNRWMEQHAELLGDDPLASPPPGVSALRASEGQG
jgi:hypothetical protein